MFKHSHLCLMGTACLVLVGLLAFSAPADSASHGSKSGASARHSTASNKAKPAAKRSAGRKSSARSKRPTAGRKQTRRPSTARTRGSRSKSGPASAMRKTPSSRSRASAAQRKPAKQMTASKKNTASKRMTAKNSPPPVRPNPAASNGANFTNKPLTGSINADFSPAPNNGSLAPNATLPSASTTYPASFIKNPGGSNSGNGQNGSGATGGGNGRRPGGSLASEGNNGGAGSNGNRSGGLGSRRGSGMGSLGAGQGTGGTGRRRSGGRGGRPTGGGSGAGGGRGTAGGGQAAPGGGSSGGGAGGGGPAAGGGPAPAAPATYPMVLSGQEALDALRSAYGLRPSDPIPVPSGNFPGGIYGAGFTPRDIGGKPFIDESQRIAIVKDMPEPTGPFTTLTGQDAVGSLRRQGYPTNPDGSLKPIENMSRGNVTGAGYGTTPDGSAIDPNNAVVITGPEPPPPPPPPPNIWDLFRALRQALQQGRSSAAQAFSAMDVARGAVVGARFFGRDPGPDIRAAAQEFSMDEATMRYLLEMPQDQWNSLRSLFQ